MKFVNLTPHEVVVYGDDGSIRLRIPPSGTVARVETRSVVVGEVNGVPVRATEYGDIVGLPGPEADTVYIVSTVLLIALRAKGINRDDVVAPDTNPDSVIRDPEGRVIGVKYFQVVR